MRLPPPMHEWDISPREAIKLQRQLAPRVRRTGVISERSVRAIAGGDVAFDRATGRAVAAVVLLAWPTLETIEQVSVEVPVRFPYVPGLLSFRETPALLAAFERLRLTPDLLFVDGHGYAHPRRFGFACHIGLWLGIPSIGVAKSLLVGAHGAVGPDRGARADLVHEGEVVGAMLRTRARVRPVAVSVGTGLSLASAERWVLRAAAGYRIPEPTRRADHLAGAGKRRMLDATLDVIIEQRRGEPGRWEYDPEEDRVAYRFELAPMPEHYGCSTTIVNLADGELLDVIVVDDREREQGERLRVRIVDMLERGDGDHKLLALPVDVPPCARTTARRLDRARHASWQWYVDAGKPVVRWAGEEAALATIAACRSATPEATQR